MTTEDSVPAGRTPDLAPLPEVEFALVLSRMIESVKGDPEGLRQAVYELARYKLQEQFSHSDAKDVKRTRQALEAAITGVENFSKRHDTQPVLHPPIPLWLATETPTAAPLTIAYEPPIRTHPRRTKIDAPPSSEAMRRPWGAVQRTLGITVAIVIALVAFQQRDRLRTMIGSRATRPQTAEVQFAAPVVPPPQPIVPAKPTRVLPTAYGVYAASDGTFTELKQLLGRPPDMRVAISATVNDPPKVTLTDKNPRFIVFRRDVAANFSDKADVRFMAKISRQFASAGEAEQDDKVWVIRNIAVFFRASPIPDNPDMYELVAEDPASPLPPGRYVLALKTTMYDFSIAGAVTDPRHCLERVVSTNGTFYSECPKPKK